MHTCAFSNAQLAAGRGKSATPGAPLQQPLSVSLAAVPAHLSHLIGLPRPAAQLPHHSLPCKRAGRTSCSQAHKTHPIRCSILLQCSGGVGAHLDIIQADQQSEQRRFARAAGADHCAALPGLHLQTHSLQHRPIRLVPAAQPSVSSIKISIR